jgi:hypothetical protein
LQVNNLQQYLALSRRSLLATFVVVGMPLNVWNAKAGSVDEPAGGPKQAEAESRQVTLMAIRAIKGTGPVDPKLASVAGQLAQVLPGHHFELIEGKTRRLAPKQALVLKTGENSVLTLELKSFAGDEGKVEMKLRLALDGREPFESSIKTPPNQLFFLDRKLGENDRLLIAVGAR